MNLFKKFFFNFKIISPYFKSFCLLQYFSLFDAISTVKSLCFKTKNFPIPSECIDFYGVIQIFLNF